MSQSSCHRIADPALPLRLGRSVTARNLPVPADPNGKVIQFRPRAIAARHEPDLQDRSWNPRDASGRSNVIPFGRVASASEGPADDARLLQNGLAAAVLMLLMTTGFWVVNTFAHVS